MEHRVFDSAIIVRMDPDEEVMEQLKIVCEKEKIQLAQVAALGALKEFTVGLFNTQTKEYKANTFTFPSEITSLWGTVTTQEGAFYPHIHMSAADETGREYGGHLQRAVISATVEMVITPIADKVEREFSPAIGLNLMKFM